MKEAFALGASLAFIVTGAVVGARLILLARRTRGTAEGCLGLALFAIAGLAYPVLIVSAGLDTGTKRAMAATGAGLLGFGWSCLWIFTWTTFRREAAWARAISILAIVATLVISAWRIVRIAGDDPSALQLPSVHSLGPQMLAQAVYVWTSVEAFRYWTMLKKRVRLGLADPTVANRFLLWGLMGVFSFASLVVPIASTFHRSADMLTLSRLAVGITGTVCSTVLYLAFLPPKAYLRWVGRGGAPAA
jgi:hypothetical protein